MLEQVSVDGWSSHLTTTFLVAAETENNASRGLEVPLLKQMFNRTHDRNQTTLRIA